MREVSFLHQNSQKWKEFEEMMKEGERSTDPNRLTDLFVELTDDLSYAQTFYRESKSARYLNALCAKVHQKLYRNKREKAARFITFWTKEVPLVIRSAHKELLVSFAIFMVSAAIGALSLQYDQRFARLVLGDGYVNMTEENIKKGDAMAVYKERDGWSMFLSIALNNELVSMRVFILGIACTVGTVFMLFYNGLMVGVFQFLFAQHGVMLDSVRGIWIHGTLEIAGIVVAGAAGIVLGNGILFPGTYSRAESFKRGAAKGMKIMVGLVPQILFAAALESYVTRFSNVQTALSWIVIFTSAVFVVWYYVVYPMMIERKLQSE